MLTLVVGLTTGIWRMGDGDGSRIGKNKLGCKAFPGYDGFCPGAWFFLSYSGERQSLTSGLSSLKKAPRCSMEEVKADDLRALNTLGHSLLILSLPALALIIQFLCPVTLARADVIILLSSIWYSGRIQS